MRLIANLRRIGEGESVKYWEVPGTKNTRQESSAIIYPSDKLNFRYVEYVFWETWQIKIAADRRSRWFSQSWNNMPICTMDTHACIVYPIDLIE